MAWMGSALQVAYDFITNLVPVDKWIQATGNVLKLLALIAVCIAILFLALLAGGSAEMEAKQIFALALMLGFLLLVVLVIAAYLATKTGDALYAPSERHYVESLSRLKRYGSKGAELSRQEVLAEPAIEKTDQPALPLPQPEVKP